MEKELGTHSPKETYYGHDSMSCDPLTVKTVLHFWEIKETHNPHRVGILSRLKA